MKHSLLAALFVTTLSPGWSQTSARIEALTPVEAPRLLRGLGWNVTLDQEWEFAKVREAHGKEVRIQFSWEAVETNDGKLQLPPKFQDALKWCTTYQLEPMIVAAYGPPRQQVAELSLTEAVPAGATRLPVSGNLSAVEVPLCHVLGADRSQLVAEGKWAYYGALITAADASSITLAAKTKAPLAAGTRLVVNRLRYPSLGTEDPRDPSIQAYVRYAHFLAEQIAAYKLTGTVEIWNEPPWGHDPWDCRAAFYDTPPADLPRNSPNWGLLRGLLADHLPDHVRYTWGGSHKSGTRGILSLPAPAATQAQVSATFASEGWHPYGPTPEYSAWDPHLLTSSRDVFAAALEGSNRGSNFKVGRRIAADHLAKNKWTIPAQVSEAGFPSANQLAKARWATRFFLVHLALGPAPQIERVNFYRLAEAPEGYAMVDAKTHEDLPAFTALKTLLDTVQKIGARPLPFSEKDLPAVPRYSGAWPLITIPIVGRVSETARKNTVLFVCYQRTHAAKDADWIALNPPPTPVTITLPSGARAASALNIVTRERVTLNTMLSRATFPVGADPIAVEITPGN